MNILKKLKQERKALARAIADFERIEARSVHAVAPKKRKRDTGRGL
jgi:hypothetical protein